ncbi:4Fe-4S dicluster domain-containing protein [Dehalogenimonas etheniformans]|uniref:4Fe-4S dicluster domain-containing protein n=1 Tax=Dehalogenimonas etheniformans TaxID=1536648 RepID=A0A2P5P9W9_9CHLR|nr:4Fe-4S dicluster domain-containing protein [Dehalogenimonas etheniformans]PPD59103.1 4Fe-4S dicluster domain-containing protein [Dehalogenimonas etheniformans]QNT75851.1 4Fe-4S dicluster domain-containing protein [Dehalogenimonas etheniformans]
MAKGLLIDTVKCTGCRGCQTACKQWNLNPAVETKFSPTMTNPLETNAYSFVHVEFYENSKSNGDLDWTFVSKRCMHCEHPACVSVCPVGALQKLDFGPVVWEEGRCIGCRYCQNACPFDIPKYTWFDENGKTDPWPKIAKCTLCWDRQLNKTPSEIPACSKTCPPKAILFGERSDLLAIAKDRIAKSPDKYFNHIYGEEEVGGTQVMFISSQDPHAIGFPDVEKESYPGFTWEFLSRIPYEIAGLGAILVGTYVWRSNRLKKKALEESAVSNTKGGSH